MPSSDINHLWTSSIDLYELLGIPPEATQREIDQARRKTALKYHPDKDGSEDAKNKFRVTQDACSGLSDPPWRATYDLNRAARREQEVRRAAYQGKRKHEIDDLELRERGFKKSRHDAEDAEEREFRRLAQEGERRRRELEETRRRGAQIAKEEEVNRATSPPVANGQGSKSGVSEIDRTVKVRWSVEGEGGSLTVDQVRKLFSKFGKIESADLLGQKMTRLAGSKKKQMAVTCMVLYTSVVGAHEAVEGFRKQEEPSWQIFDSVQWAANKEPEWLNASATKSVHGSAPSTPSRKGTPNFSDSPKRFQSPATPKQSPEMNGKTLNKRPSFASFSAAAASGASTPKGSPFGKGLGPNSPSLEEMTMIRLRKLEQKRLAAEIEREDKEADARSGADTEGTKA